MTRRPCYYHCLGVNLPLNTYVLSTAIANADGRPAEAAKPLRGLSNRPDKCVPAPELALKAEFCSKLSVSATNSSELQSVIDARQKLESQQQENKTVQNVCESKHEFHPRFFSFFLTKAYMDYVLQELARLSDDSVVFKLIGPVLLKQDKGEAVMTVNRRLEFIESEM